MVDGRDRSTLDTVAEGDPGARTAQGARVVTVAGDVTDPDHRDELVARRHRARRRLDLLVNNASTSAVARSRRSPTTHSTSARHVYEVNVVAPLALVQDALPCVDAPRGRIVNVTSDAAVEAYEGWGGYGSSKAALEQLTAVLAEERPGRCRVYGRPW